MTFKNISTKVKNNIFTKWKLCARVYLFTHHLKSIFLFVCVICCGSEGKASACNAGNLGSIPGSGRSPGEGNGNPLQYSCLENSMDWGAWWATVHGVAESDTPVWLHFHFHYLTKLFILSYYSNKNNFVIFIQILFFKIVWSMLQLLNSVIVGHEQS